VIFEQILKRFMRLVLFNENENDPALQKTQWSFSITLYVTMMLIRLDVIFRENFMDYKLTVLCCDHP